MTGIGVFRAMLLTIATGFGALGISFLYYSCVSAPVGDYAVIFLQGHRRSHGSSRNQPKGAKPAGLRLTKLAICPHTDRTYDHADQ